MFRPGDFGNAYPQGYASVTSTISQPGRHINITKLDSTRSRWDKPIEVPDILYRRFKIEPYVKKQQKVEGKSYPVQLVQFIQRSYSKCTNQQEKKHMQSELRKIINENQKKLNQVNWRQQQTPTIPKMQSLPKQTTAPSLVPMVNNVSTQIIKAKQTNNNISKVDKSLPKVDTINSLPKFQFQSSPVKFIPQSIPQPKWPSKTDKKSQSKSNQPKKQQYQYKVGKFSEAPPPSIKPTKFQQKNKKVEQKVVAPTSPVKLKPLVIIQQTNVAKRLQRLSRFKGTTPIPRQVTTQYDDNQFDINQKIIGTCKDMQKQYLRITSAIDPSTVRPQPVLKKVLQFLKNKYKNGSPYEYLSEQFRSLRQDLLVQHIRNQFTVQVYQQNSRISLFSDDMGQFHQCQSALWDLYKNGIYKTLVNKYKFLGFQLLTLIMDQKFRQLQFMLTFLKPDELQSEDVQKMLKVRQMLTMGNYTQFFNFYATQDPLSKCLLNQYIDKIRASCIALFSKTLGQKISIDDLASILNDNSLMLQQMIIDMGGTVRSGFFYCKQSYAAIQQCQLLFKKKRVTLTLN